MKKALMLALSVLMIFAFISCDNSGENYTPVSTVKELTNALTTGGRYILENDLEIPAGNTLSLADGLSLNLNEKTIKSHALFNITDAEVVIENGSLAFSDTGRSKSNASIQIMDRGNLRLNSVTLTSDITGIFLVNNTESPTLTLNNSIVDVSGYYGIGTNALAPTTTNAVINITGSSVDTTKQTEDNDNTALLVNVDADVTIANSEFHAARQAIIARGGNYDISDTELYVTCDYNGNDGYYLPSETWKDGNRVSCGGLIIGNNSSGVYEYPTDITLTNVNVYMDNPTESNFYGIVATMVENYSVSVSGDITINELGSGTESYFQDGVAHNSLTIK